MAGMTTEEKKHFDDKLDKMNTLLTSIHQVLVGFEGKGGYLHKVDCIEAEQGEQRKILNKLIEKKDEKLLSKKMIWTLLISIFGSNGLLITVFLLIINAPKG